MKKLGIIGGMGPLATQLLYKEIIERTKADSDQEHIDMVILNHASMPDRTMSIKSGDTDEIVSYLKADARFLENAGVDGIMIPCNTSHYFYKEIQDSVSIPVINMVEKTVEFAKNKGAKKLGILATEGTIFAGVYEKECKRLGIEYFAPDDEIQKIVTRIIYDQIKKGIRGSDEDFSKIDEHLRQNGCDLAILACTELSCYKKQTELSSFYIDALEILAQEGIRFAEGTIKKEVK